MPVSYSCFLGMETSLPGGDGTTRLLMEPHEHYEAPDGLKTYRTPGSHPGDSSPTELLHLSRECQSCHCGGVGFSVMRLSKCLVLL